MTEEEKYEWIEKYLEGQLSPSEKADFEVNMLSDDDFAAEVSKQEEFMKQLNSFSKKIQLTEELGKIHQELFDSPSLTQKERAGGLRAFWNNHKITIGIAASLMLISSFSTILIINQLYFSKNKNEKMAYEELRKEESESPKKESTASTKQSEKADKAETKESVSPKSMATAFAITENGYLISTYHAVKGAGSIYAERFIQDTLQRYVCSIVFADEKKDLVLLQITDQKFVGLGALNYTFRNEELDLGEKVFTLAYPRNEIVYGEGSISAKTGYQADTMAYQISIPVNPGNSGSPLIDEKGNFAGLIKGKSNEMTGAAFAIKVKYIQQLLQKVPQNKLGKPLILPQYNAIQWLNRAGQVKQLQNFVFILRVYQ